MRTTIIGTILLAWSTREYRLLSLAMLLVGSSVSSGVPLVTLFLTQRLGASDSLAGLFFLTALAGPPINILLGRLSDRLRSRAPLLAGGAFWLAAGWGLMALSTSPLAVFSVGTIFLCFIGVVNAQVFAVVRDVVERKREQRDATVTSVVRTAYSFGWMLGPVLGSLVAAWAGYRAAFVLAAALLVAVLVPVARLDSGRPRREAERAEPVRPRPPAKAPLLLFGLVCVLVLTSETVRQAYLPILAVDRLGIELGRFGILMSVAPLTELVAMPLAGVLADRLGVGKVLLAGFATGGLGFAAFGISSNTWHLYAGQVLSACFIAVVFGLGVTYAHNLSPGSAGLASSVFFSAQSLSLLTGGLVGSAGVKLLDLPHLFFVPALLCGLACVLFVWSDRSRFAGPSRR